MANSRKDIEPLSKDLRNIADDIDAARLFQDRGFSPRTVKALVDCSIDAPERLLFVSRESIKFIPGVGKASLEEIDAYRSRFLPSA